MCIALWVCTVCTVTECVMFLSDGCSRKSDTKHSFNPESIPDINRHEGDPRCGLWETE